MGSQVVFLLFSIAAINSASSAETNSSLWVISEQGDIEYLNSSAIVIDSSSTQSELSAAVIFYLYTNSSQETPEVITLGDDDSLSSSGFDPEIPTRILIHGWRNSVNSTMPTSIRVAYLAQGIYNVIVVDWSQLAGRNYVYAREKVVTVGEYIGRMIDYLASKGMSPGNLTLVGHSLGAHVAAVACDNSSNTVGSLVGLDPAGPIFYLTAASARMSPTDAGYVQAIHTNAGELGTVEDVGHADFWLNGGTNQPGCGFGISGASCSHSRSYLYFAESIGPGPSQFVAVACGSYLFYELGFCSSGNSSYMGGSTLDTTASGKYYLNTNEESPYAQG